MILEISEKEAIMLTLFLCSLICNVLLTYVLYSRASKRISRKLDSILDEQCEYIEIEIQRLRAEYEQALARETALHKRNKKH